MSNQPNELSRLMTDPNGTIYLITFGRDGTVQRQQQQQQPTSAAASATASATSQGGVADGVGPNEQPGATAGSDSGNQQQQRQPQPHAPLHEQQEQQSQQHHQSQQSTQHPQTSQQQQQPQDAVQGSRWIPVSAVPLRDAVSNHNPAAVNNTQAQPVPANPFANPSNVSVAHLLQQPNVLVSLASMYPQIFLQLINNSLGSINSAHPDHNALATFNLQLQTSLATQGLQSGLTNPTSASGQSATSHPATIEAVAAGAASASATPLAVMGNQIFPTTATSPATPHAANNPQAFSSLHGSSEPHATGTHRLFNGLPPQRGAMSAASLPHAFHNNPNDHSRSDDTHDGLGVAGLGGPDAQIGNVDGSGSGSRSRSGDGGIMPFLHEDDNPTDLARQPQDRPSEAALAAQRQPWMLPALGIDSNATIQQHQQNHHQQHHQQHHQHQQNHNLQNNELHRTLLFSDEDRSFLSDYQCFVRQQIEYFEATTEDAVIIRQGRNKPIILGQVGIQCRHCAMLSIEQRQSGAVYFPSKLSGIYQTAQQMAQAHLMPTKCQHIPASVRKRLVELRKNKSLSSSGKAYWSTAAQRMNLVERDGVLRFNRNQDNPT